MYFQSFLPYQSVTYCQAFLLRCYQKSGQSEPTAHSYRNSYPFCYYLEHGKNYYHQAGCSPYEIKPVLLFYGMVQLLKACLLIVNPHYPENSKVLSHGVTARKQKKKDYLFLEDTVRIQRHGLFSQALEKMFHMEPPVNRSFVMDQLLRQIPEMGVLYYRLRQTAIHYQLKKEGPARYSLSGSILDDWHMTADRFTSFLAPYGLLIADNNSLNKLSVKLSTDFRPADHQLLQMTLDHELFLPSRRKDLNFFPEAMVHYLILYNLSMICRYETEWWYDLHFQRASADIAFIKQFLDVSSRKIPAILLDFITMMEERS